MYQGVLFTEAGIEPALFPWKGNVLPLDYSKKGLLKTPLH